MVAKKKPKLGPEAWIAAALEKIAHEGAAGVRVEVLAKALKVTKGSFYWHFADRRALLDAVIENWEKVATADVITQVEKNATAPEDRLAKLVAICIGSDEADRIEAGMRAWGASDPAVAEALERSDRRRLEYVTNLLVEAGQTRAVARRRARILYLALIGEFTYRAHGGARSTRALQTELVSLMLSTQDESG